MKKLVFFAVLTASLAMAARNAVQGAGRDLEAAGSAVSDAARDAK